MIRNKFFKNVLMCALTVALVATPALASASTTGSGTGNTSGGGSSSSSSAPATPAAVANDSSVKLADGTKVVSTVQGHYYANNVAGVAVTTPLADVNAALAVGQGEKAQVRVYKSACGKEAQACLNNAAAALGVSAGPTLDIFAGKVANGKYTNVDKTSAPVQFAIGVPNNFKEAGMDYAVIRVQVGGTVTVLTDLDSDPNTVTFATDGFGVFAFVKAPAGSFNAFK